MSETRKEESPTCIIFPIVLGRVPRLWNRHTVLGGSSLNSFREQTDHTDGCVQKLEFSHEGAVKTVMKERPRYV